MKNKLWIVVLLLLFATLGYFPDHSQSKPTNPSTTQSQVSELRFAYKPIIAPSVSSEERQDIETFVSEFEGYAYKKSPDKLLALFTPPATKDEQNDLDFLLGKDLAPSATKPLARLFSTQGYNYTVSGHLIREIRKLHGNLTVYVDELRTVYSGGEYVGYVTKVDSLVFELKPVNDGYKIDRYYHSKPTGKTLKYEGFIGS